MKQKKVITDVGSTVSKTRHSLHSVFACMFYVYAPVFAGLLAFLFVSTLLFCLKLHTLLSGLSSQQAHLEMRYKTAINIELYRGGGIIFSGVGPNHYWASVGGVERRNDSD